MTPGIADISLLGSMGSEICIAGYVRLLVRRNTVLLDTARHSWYLSPRVYGIRNLYRRVRKVTCNGFARQPIALWTDIQGNRNCENTIYIAGYSGCGGNYLVNMERAIYEHIEYIEYIELRINNICLKLSRDWGRSAVTSAPLDFLDLESRGFMISSRWIKKLWSLTLDCWSLI